MVGDEPVGGQWNFDADNREAFGAAGPGDVPPRTTFTPDAVTREVIALVNTRFAAHPGRLDSFVWPVTRAQALQSMRAFIKERLPLFGRYQDAMWPGDPPARRGKPGSLQLGPAAAEGRLLVNKLADQIRTQIQTMIDGLLGKRRSPVLSAFLG